MKRLKLFLGAAALITVTATVSPALNAQEKENRDMDGNIVRGPYETNRFGDNWFIGAGGGINIFWNEGYDVKVAPSIDANFGKWFTPAVGMRIGYLIGGAVVIEVIFNLPGMGATIVSAINSNYTLLVMGVVLVVAITFIIINIIVDMLYILIDPRIRTV